MVEFGEKVKKLREEKGMTQQTMADQLYVTRQAVSRWECGARFPDLLTAKKNCTDSGGFRRRASVRGGTEEKY
ncbi:MAG: helix-turn-helix transcriptional regulator [Eisenbergiella massiliensis]